MPEVQLGEAAYKVAQSRAEAGGFPTVGDYVTELLIEQGSGDAGEDMGHLFTPERLARMDRAAEEIKAGEGVTLDEARARFAEMRDRWVEANGS